jgi:hypothetical protein
MSRQDKKGFRSGFGLVAVSACLVAMVFKKKKFHHEETERTKEAMGMPSFQSCFSVLLFVFFVSSWFHFLEVYNTAFAQTTAFTYQGRLTDAGNPASGNYDLQFKLFDAPSGGTQIMALLAGEDEWRKPQACLSPAEQFPLHFHLPPARNDRSFPRRKQ